MPASVGNTKIKVGGLTNIFINPQMIDRAHIISPDGMKHIVGVTAKHLPRHIHEKPLGRGKNVLNRKARVVDAIFPAHQVGVDQRTIDPRQHVVVHRIHLAESRPHFPYLCHKTLGDRRERDVTLLHIYAFLAEG